MFASSKKAAAVHFLATSTKGEATHRLTVPRLWLRKMERIHSIMARFPQRELDIQRRCARDANFNSACADYAEAAAALCHWRKVVKDGERKVGEYESFLTELETEILEKLNIKTRGDSDGTCEQT